MGKFWLILSRHLSSVVWCMSENFTLAFIPSDLARTSRKCTGTSTTLTEASTEERHFSSYEQSQRLLSLRSDAEYLTINCSWISEAFILEPWTCQLWITPPPPHPPHLYVCVCIYVSFRPYLLMETSEALELLYIFNAVKLSFLSTVCC